jgi:hypothetical protein
LIKIFNDLLIKNNYLTNSQLDSHISANHTGLKLYKCEETDCDFDTNYLKHMKDHKLKHDPNYVPPTNGQQNSDEKSIENLDENYINMKTGDRNLVHSNDY